MRKYVVLVLAVLALLAIAAVPAFAQPVGEQFCAPWDWAWYGGPGHWYWQWFQDCWSPFQGWYRIWGGWGV